MRKGVFIISLFVLMISLMGCHTHKQTTQSSEKVSITETKDNGPVILFVAGTIAYDSLTNAYSVKINQQKKFSGKLNLEKSENIKEPQGLNYIQLDANDQQLSRCEMENPLIQRIEYVDGDEFKMKTTIRQEAELYLRLQLDPKASKLQFCNNQEIIETIVIEQ